MMTPGQRRTMKHPPLASRIALIVFVTISTAICANGQELPAEAGTFKGRMLIAACDTDMLPAAYLGGGLGPEVGPDQLAVIRLDRPLSRLRPTTIPVTNSVTGPPASLVTTPDGRYAIVIETRGPRPHGAVKLADLLPGRAITVVDLADPDQPKVVQRVQGFEHPLSISINKNGSLVAIAHPSDAPPGTPPLALYRFADGRLSQPLTPSIPGFVPGQSLISARFHPLQDALALVYDTPSKLTFVQVGDHGAQLTLTSWGNDVAVDPSSFTAVFTPDGRFVLVNAMLPFIRGTVTSIRVGANEGPGQKADGRPHHFPVSSVQAGIFPEGLAISPDAHWAVTSNLENSTWPVNDPRQGFYSSLTLLRFAPETGQLTRVGDFPFDGMLPEAPVFDDSSRFVAVTNYSQFRNPAGGGSIDFWRIADDAFDPQRAELVKMMESVPVPRGPQSMAIIRAQ